MVDVGDFFAEAVVVARELELVFGGEALSLVPIRAAVAANDVSEKIPRRRMEAYSIPLRKQGWLNSF